MPRPPQGDTGRVGGPQAGLPALRLKQRRRRGRGRAVEPQTLPGCGVGLPHPGAARSLPGTLGPRKPGRKGGISRRRRFPLRPAGGARTSAVLTGLRDSRFSVCKAIPASSCAMAIPASPCAAAIPASPCAMAIPASPCAMAGLVMGRVLRPEVRSGAPCLQLPAAPFPPQPRTTPPASPPRGPAAEAPERTPPGLGSTGPAGASYPGCCPHPPLCPEWEGAETWQGGVTS